MGYCSCFILSAAPMTESLYAKIDEELQHYGCNFECEGIENGVGHWYDGDDTWYSCRADMLQVSQAFPDVRFTLYVAGEDREDIWRAYFQNSRFQVNDASIIYAPFIPSRMQAALDDGPQEYEELANAERAGLVEAALYHCLRSVLGVEETDFPWNPELMKDAERACKEFLASHGFTVPEYNSHKATCHEPRP